MKKILFAGLAVLMLLAVSCATTDVVDIHPVVRELPLSYYSTNGKTYSVEKTYRMIDKFLWNEFREESKQAVKDDNAKTITLKGYEFDAFVGPLAQDGKVVTDIVFQALENEIRITINFKDSYYFVYTGVLKTKMSGQGLTQLGMDMLESQATYFAESFVNALNAYIFYQIDNYL